MRYKNAAHGRDELAIVVLSVGGLGLAVGLYLSMLSARAVADPVNSLRAAVQEVQDGELDIEVPVYDASEIGELQAGVNSMVAGLRERERIQDLFGRHVGEDVARAALDQGIELGGERRDVAVLFTTSSAPPNSRVNDRRRRWSSCSTPSSASSSTSSTSTVAG